MINMTKIENMETFKKNLEGANFSPEFIRKAIEYFYEIKREKKLLKMNNLEEVIDYYNRSFSFSWNTEKSENNLKELRKDLFLLYEKDSNNLLDFNEYFENIEVFEIYVLYVLYFEFYPMDC